MAGQTVFICSWIVTTGFPQIIQVFGVVSNIINIICVIKQGLNESVNVSLLGLAISDLGSLLTLLWGTAWIIPAVSTAKLPFEVIGFYYLTSGTPHVTFTRVTSWITAIITLERALCVLAPLKVKRIITPKRVTALIVCIFIILISCVTPVYTVNSLIKKYFPGTNRTLLILHFSANRDNVEKICFIINNFILPFSAFIVIIICTIILVICLRRRTIWLQTMTCATNTDISVRSQKVAKMVVVISVLFIACFVPFTIIIMAIAFDPRLAVGGEYINVSLMIGNVGFLLETINSSANIFIYYNMSTKYRDAFHMIFRVCRKRKSKKCTRKDNSFMNEL